MTMNLTDFGTPEENTNVMSLNDFGAHADTDMNLGDFGAEEPASTFNPAEVEEPSMHPLLQAAEVPVTLGKMVPQFLTSKAAGLGFMAGNSMFSDMTPEEVRAESDRVEEITASMFPEAKGAP